jgi:hypothetical protein
MWLQNDGLAKEKYESPMGGERRERGLFGVLDI